MLKGFLFLWKWAWKVEKRYPLCVILNALCVSIGPLLIMVMPKLLLDEYAHENRLMVLVGLALGFSALIFIVNQLGDWLKFKAFTFRFPVLKAFQSDLSRRLVESDYQNLENPDYLNLKTSAEKFFYAEGQGFSFVLDRAVGIGGQVIVFLTIAWIVSMLSWWVLLVFTVLTILNLLIQSSFRKTYARIDMEKNPKERELMYFSSLFTQFEYGKDLRTNGDPKFFLDELDGVQDRLKVFYKKQMNIMSNSRLLSAK